MCGKSLSFFLGFSMETSLLPFQTTVTMMEIILMLLGLVLLNNFLLKYAAVGREKVPILFQFFPDAIITTSVGLGFGIILNILEQKSVLYVIQQEYISLFLIILLPPIMFER